MTTVLGPSRVLFVFIFCPWYPKQGCFASHIFHISCLSFLLALTKLSPSTHLPVSVIEHHVSCIYRVQKISMPNLREVIGGTKTKIYCQTTICWSCSLAAPWNINSGLTKAGNQAKPLKYSEKKNICNLLPVETRCSNVWPLTLIHSQCQRNRS